MKNDEYESIIKNLTENIEEGILIINKDGYGITYNKTMEVLEKTQSKDVLSKHYRDVFSHIEQDASTLYKALEKGIITKDLKQTFINQYGKETTTINTTIPVKNNRNQIIAAIEIARDVTSIKNMSDTIHAMQNDLKGMSTKILSYNFDNIIGQDKLFLSVIERAKKAAKNSATVLIYGETGTGKELFAQSIHFLSERKHKPFLAQNCSALPESLLEGILFGTTKGGFTGAIDRQGLFEQANGGTLLLDEISAMPIELQGKLLRVLQESYVRRVGGEKDIKVDVRIIATINEDAKLLIDTGRLRSDLYYRLNIIKLDIPPLRMRKGDIEELCKHFIGKYNEKLSKNVIGITEKALDAFLRYDYPGNVREIENMIYSAISLVEGSAYIDIDNVEFSNTIITNNKTDLNYNNSINNLPEYIESIEKSIIEEKLSSSNLSLSKIAKQLGIKRQTLQYKMKKYGLECCQCKNAQRQ